VTGPGQDVATTTITPSPTASTVPVDPSIGATPDDDPVHAAGKADAIADRLERGGDERARTPEATGDGETGGATSATSTTSDGPVAAGQSTKPTSSTPSAQSEGTSASGADGATAGSSAASATTDRDHDGRQGGAGRDAGSPGDAQAHAHPSTPAPMAAGQGQDAAVGAPGLARADGETVAQPAMAPGSVVPPAPGLAPAPAPGAQESGAPAPAPATGTAPPPAEQLVSVLSPLRVLGGTHQVTLALNPEGLGTVRATVTMGDQHLVVQLVADSPDGHEALRQALPQLRTLLHTGSGTTSVTLTDTSDLGPGSDSPDQSNNTASTTAPPASAGREDDAAVPPVLSASHPTTADRRLVDVRL
jgi:flagellar hook-length control protein FliK